MSEAYSDYWYELVENDSLRQGDLFRGLLVYWLPRDLPLAADAGATHHLEYTRADWIILTASCDLDQRRSTHVLMGRVVEATPEFLKCQSEKEYQQRLEVVRRGLDPGKFLLPGSSRVNPPLEMSIALFRTQVLLPVEYLQRNCTGPRLRLQHPFREKFGNWVGARFSDVGPEDHVQIPPITRIFEKHVLDAQE